LLLRHARTPGWKTDRVRGAGQEVSPRPQVLRALPGGGEIVSFSVLCADPPWKFGDKLPGAGRGAEKNYSCMTVDELCAFELPPLAPDCYLFMWRVSSMVEEAYRVVRAWGFAPKSEIVWQKLTATGKPWFGMGRTVRASHETAIIAVRGKPRPIARSVRSTFSAVALKEKHSAKPEAFYDIVESLAAGPYVELFARRQRAGWTCRGDQA
jgi:N6-adenosine-specific RNA methylase IME4